MALQDVIMANVRLNNVLLIMYYLSTNIFLQHLMRENANFC